MIEAQSMHIGTQERTEDTMLRIVQDGLTKEWLLFRVGQGIVSVHKTRKAAVEAATALQNS
jgi:hypothetical protein